MTTMDKPRTHAARMMRVHQALANRTLTVAEVAQATGIALPAGYLRRLQAYGLVADIGDSGWRLTGLPAVSRYGDFASDDTRYEIDKMLRANATSRLNDLALYAAYDMVTFQNALRDLQADGVIRVEDGLYSHTAPHIPLATPAYPDPLSATIEPEEIDPTMTTTEVAPVSDSSPGKGKKPPVPTQASLDALSERRSQFTHLFHANGGVLSQHRAMKVLRLSRAVIDDVVESINQPNTHSKIDAVYVDAKDSRYPSLGKVRLYVDTTLGDDFIMKQMEKELPLLLSANVDARTEEVMLRILQEDIKLPSDIVYMTDMGECSSESVRRVQISLCSRGLAVMEGKHIKLLKPTVAETPTETASEAIAVPVPSSPQPTVELEYRVQQATAITWQGVVNMLRQLDHGQLEDVAAILPKLLQRAKLAEDLAALDADLSNAQQG